MDDVARRGQFLRSRIRRFFVPTIFAVGQKTTSAFAATMSAIRGKSDIVFPVRDVR